MLSSFRHWKCLKRLHTLSARRHIGVTASPTFPYLRWSTLGQKALHCAPYAAFRGGVSHDSSTTCRPSTRRARANRSQGVMRAAPSHTRVRTDNASNSGLSAGAHGGTPPSSYSREGPDATATQDSVDLIGAGAKRQLSQSTRDGCWRRDITRIPRSADGENGRSNGID